MSNQPEALRLADELDCRGTSRPKWQDQLDAASELRRLHAEVERLREAARRALEALEALQGGCTDSDDGTVEAITVWCPEVAEALRAALKETK